MDVLKINTSVYAVSKTYIDSVLPLNGARVIPCRIKTYQNDKGSIITICSSSIVKGEITSNSHKLFQNLEDAIVAIGGEVPSKTPKTTKKKVTTKKK